MTHTIEELRILQDMRDQKRWDDQTKIVAAYLERYGELNRDYAYDVGLDGCGRIKNLGARIHELRQEGWLIRTEKRQGVCWYVLEAKPAATH